MLNRIKSCSFITLLFALVSVSAQAAVSPWVQTEHSRARLISGVSNQGKLQLGIEIIADPGWKMYWRTPGDAGFPPDFNWQKSKNAKNIKVLWPVPQRVTERYETLELESFIYKDRLLLPVTLEARDHTQPLNLRLELNYGLCKEICIPVNAPLALDIAPNAQDEKQQETIAQSMAHVPAENGSGPLFIQKTQWVEENGKQYIQVKTKAKKPFDAPDLLIETPAMFKFSPPHIQQIDDTHAVLKSQILPTIDKTLSIRGQTLTLTLTDGHTGVETTFTPQTLQREAADNHLWLLMLWFAFMGGLILNIMPCVLPVLSIKLLTILQQGGGEIALIRKSFWASAAGVLAAFLALGSITLAVKATGQAAGWGFHFQNPMFLTALIVLLALFAGNMMGRFAINLPRWVSDFLVENTPFRNHTVAGDFMAGIFATILATPCTAPFLGTAISFALARGSLEILLIFGFMGLGLGFPYIVFALFPHFVSKLPKPGAWMVKVKYVLAALLGATALWLLWVLSHSLGAKAALVVFLGVLLVKFVMEWKTHPLLRIIGLVITLAITFTLPFSIASQERLKQELTSTTWQVFDEATIPPLVAQGKIVFVDVTADWCLTCKFNKLWVLNREDVMQRFKDEGIIAMRADITKPDPRILEYLQRHERYGIPFNIVYGPGAPKGMVLSEVLSVGEVNLALRQAGKRR